MEGIMTRWEYCAVSGISTGGHILTHYPYLIRFPPDGPEATHLKGTRDRKERDVVAQTIAELGENGWELVSAVYAGGDFGTYSLWFKRPKQ